MQPEILMVDFRVLTETSAFRSNAPLRPIPGVTEKMREPLHDEIDAHEICRCREEIVYLP
jgi:hypothetical protein